MANYSKERKTPRVTIALPAAAKMARRTMFEAKVLSLSEGGAFLGTREKLTPGTEIILFMTLDLPRRGKSCIAQGRVVWTNSTEHAGPVGCGIAFAECSSGMKKLLRDFVEFKLTGKVTAMGVAEDSKQTKPPARGPLRG